MLTNARSYSRLMQLILIVLAATLLIGASCTAPTEFTSPLSPPDQKKINQELLGRWYFTDRDGSELVHLLLSEAEDGTAFMVRLSDSRGFLVAVAYPSEIGDRIYYNVKRSAGKGVDYTPDEEEPGYIIVHTDLVDESHLRVHFMRNKVIRQLMEAGRIKGRVLNEESDTPVNSRMPGSATYIVVELNQEELRNLLDEIGHKKLFTTNDGMTMKRLPSWEPEKAEDWKARWVPPQAGQIEVVNRVARLLARTGAMTEAQEAVALAEKIRSQADEYDRPGLEDPLTLMEIHVAGGKGYEEALSALPPASRDTGMLRIAEHHVQAGRFGDSVEWVQRVGGHRQGEKIELLLKIALSQADAGELAAAKSTLNIAANECGKRGDLLSEVAAVQAAIGDTEGLNVTLATEEMIGRPIPAPLPRLPSDEAAGKRLWVDTTLAVLEGLDNPRTQVYKLAEVAEVLLDLDEKDQAKEIALRAFVIVERLSINRQAR